MISTVKCWTWPEGKDNPSQFELYRVDEPGQHPYFLEKTSEAKHYLDLLTDMLESYIHADIDRFNKLKTMVDWALPGLKQWIYYISFCSDRSDDLEEKYGEHALVDNSFITEYNKRYPYPKNDDWLIIVDRDRFRPAWKFST